MVIYLVSWDLTIYNALQQWLYNHFWDLLGGVAVDSHSFIIETRWDFIGR